MLSVVFLIMVLIIDTFMQVFGDLILIKTKLKHYKKYPAEIIYFTDEVRMNNKGGYTVLAVVKYFDSKKERKALVFKDKRDKYGDRIEIVTNGDLTARNSIVFPNKLGIASLIKDLVVMIVFGFFLYTIADLYAVVATALLLLVYVLYLAIYPLTREATDKYVKKVIGWPDHL